MYHHVVVFRFKPEVVESDVDRFAGELRAFAATLSGIVSFSCGSDHGLREGNDDFAISAVFETREALLAYLDHPKHVRIIADHVPVMVAEKHGAQFEVKALRGADAPPTPRHNTRTGL